MKCISPTYAYIEWLDTYIEWLDPVIEKNTALEHIVTTKTNKKRWDASSVISRSTVERILKCRCDTQPSFLKKQTLGSVYS